MAQLVENLPASAGDTRDWGSVPGWGRSPEEGNGNFPRGFLPRKFCRGDCGAPVHGDAESQT